MDYVEAFKNLRANNKYGRKSPHKAVLLLTVIEMYEKNIITDNEIYYDDSLKSMFLKVLNKVLPNEPLFHSDAYLPFWYLQSDSFWHIIPIRGQEDIISLMRDTNVKPSEAKLKDSVRCAELDQDLYFLMTLPSGRSSLKRVLLETYTTLPEEQIDRLAESADNTFDHSLSAMEEYEKILSSQNNDDMEFETESSNDLEKQFKELSDDLQIALSYEYFAFLKNHRCERNMLKEVCPDVFSLYDCLVNNPLRQTDISPSFAFVYDNFLSDLKIALMSENSSMELIDKIDNAIAILRSNDLNADSCDTKGINSTIDKIEDKIKQEENLQHGQIDYTFRQEDSTEKQIGVIAKNQDDFKIENTNTRCHIINNNGERVYSSSGKLKIIGKELYRVYYTDSVFSVFLIKIDDWEGFVKEKRILNARHCSPLYASLDKQKYLDQIKDVRIDHDTKESHVQVENRWYGSSGYYADLVKNNINVGPDIVAEEKQYEGSAPNELKIEHVYLDSSYNIVKTVTTSSLNDSQEKEEITESRKGKPWTQEEEERITHYFERGINTADIAERFGRTEVAIKARLAKLGLIEYIYGQDESDKTLEKGDASGSSLMNPYAQVLHDSPYTFVPKGRLKKINEIAEESYDFLLTMAVVEFMNFIPQPTIITFDRLASMMIAIAWEILNENEDIKGKEKLLKDCIEFLIAESKEQMDEVLTWGSSRKTVFNAIKDYPMADVYEDTVDALIAKAPYNVLRAWISETDEEGIVRSSIHSSASCLYAIHPMKHNPYIEILQGWKKYLLKENEELMNYYKRLYLDFLEEC